MGALVLASGGSGGGGFKVLFAVIAVLIIIGGLVQAIRPDLAWKAQRWQYKNKAAFEPSSAGLLAARLSGVVVVVVGTVILVIGLSR